MSVAYCLLMFFAPQFAHCETLVPLAALMGLFNPAAESEEDAEEIAAHDRASERAWVGGLVFVCP